MLATPNQQAFAIALEIVDALRLGVSERTRRYGIKGLRLLAEKLVELLAVSE